MMKRFIAVCALSAFCLTGVGTRAQSPTTDPAFTATTLNVSAFGETRAAPDMAMIDLGVDTSSPTAAEALRTNATRMARVIGALKAGGIADRDLQTSNLSLSPQYAYDQGKPPRLIGYQASNQVTVTVNDLTRLGAAVDAVVATGATNVSQISFGLANPVSSENTARVVAVKALEDKAALYAQAAGYHIARLVNLSEGGGYQPAPFQPIRLMAKDAAPTPVQPGELKVRIDISGVFELAR